MTCRRIDCPLDATHEVTLRFQISSETALHLGKAKFCEDHADELVHCLPPFKVEILVEEIDG